MSAKQKILKIESANYLEDYKVHILFSNGKEQIVDFEPFLKRSRHPDIKKFLSSKKFRQFNLQNGELMWGDFDLIFPIMDLYKNNLL